MHLKYNQDTVLCLIGMVFAAVWLVLLIGDMIWPMYLCPRPPEILRMMR